MQNIFSASNFVLAHGISVGTRESVFLLIVMPVIALGFLSFKKHPVALCVSSIISSLMVTLFVLNYVFELNLPKSEISKIIEGICWSAVFYPGIIFINGGILFFVMPFIIDTLIIFGIFKLILFLKNKKFRKETVTEAASPA